MAKNDAHNKRLAVLAGTTAEVSFGKDFYAKVLRMVSLWLEKFDALDQGLLDIPQQEITLLENTLKQAIIAEGWARLSLTHLAFFQLEKISLCAEAEFDTLGGKKALDMTLQELTHLTIEIGNARKKTFAATGTS